MKSVVGTECPLETLVSTENECLLAANEIGGTYKNDVTREDRPVGCYWSLEKVYFNSILDASVTSITGNRGGVCRGNVISNFNSIYTLFYVKYFIPDSD